MSKKKAKNLLKSGVEIAVGAALIGVTGQVGRGVPLIRPIQSLQSVGLLKKVKKDFRL